MDYEELANKRTALLMAIETAISMGTANEVYYLIGKLAMLEELME